MRKSLTLKMKQTFSPTLPINMGMYGKVLLNFMNLFYPELTGSKTATDERFLDQMNRQKESLVFSYSS